MQQADRMDYRDTKIILLSVPFINAINYYLTYSVIRWGEPFLYITFTLDTLEGYVAWWLTRYVIIRFDEKIPWESSLVKRNVVQLPAVVVTLVGILIVQTELVNFIATDKPLPMNFYTHDIFIFMIWAVFIHFLYMGLYFLRKFQQLRSATAVVNREDILIWTGKQQRRVEIRAFKYFMVDNELVYGITAEGKIPLPGFTLDKLEKQIDPAAFFRANRQTIITRPVVDQIQRESNGKLKVKVKDLPVGAPEIMISRLRAPAFRQWIEM